MSMNMTLALTSMPDMESAQKLADALLEKQAVACVSILPHARSHYIWKGKKECNEEVLVLIKTLTSHISQVEQILKEVHPYECPEFVCLSTQYVNDAYLQWVMQSVKVP
jgi:periplasmic divalent cation tolerance protein